MSLFTDIFNPQRKFDQAAQQIQAGIQQGQQQALPYMQGGIEALDKYYSQAAAPETQVFGSASAGANLYGDLTGANGPEGQARARAAFQTDPGYQFALNQALQATQRSTGTGGFQDSGNVLNELAKTGAGYASQQYGQWAARLAPYLGQQSQAANTLADLYRSQGQDLTSQNNSIANLLYGGATGQANAGAAALMGTQNAENVLGGGIMNLASKLLGFSKGNTFNFGGGTGGTGGTGDISGTGSADVASAATGATGTPFGAEAFGGSFIPVAV
jgi:hypothetical protein